MGHAGVFGGATGQSTRADDIGFVIEALVTAGGTNPRDMSAATVLEFYVRAPSGKMKVWTADLKTDGKDAIMTYTTVAGDLDEAGLWAIQAQFEEPEVSLTSASQRFPVGRTLRAE